MKQVKLATEDLNQLARTVAGLYQFSGSARGRARLFDQAGVGEIVRDVELEGPAADVAWDVIRRLERYGPLPAEPKYHALGALLRYVLTLGDLPQDEAQVLAGTIQRYELTDDNAYLEQLRKRYPATIDRASRSTPTADGPDSPDALGSASTSTTGDMPQLNSMQLKQLHSALLSSFPSYNSLARMVSYGLGENLSAIAGGENLAAVVFQLIEYLSAQGRLQELIVAAREENPGNPALREFVQQNRSTR